MIKTKDTLAEVIKSLAFDYVNSNVEKYFSYEEPRSADYKLFHFDRDIESEDAVKEIEAAGYSPTTLSELLAYAKDGWNNEDSVVALGSVAKVGLDRYVPDLVRRGARRRLGLDFWGGRWDRDCRFLATKVSVPKTSAPTALGNSDTLSLPN